MMIRFILLLSLLTISASCTRTSSPENTIRIYAAVDQEIAEQIFAEFYKDTGIRVEAVYDSEAAKTASLAKRLELEQESPVCDIWWSGECLYTAMLEREGCFGALPADIPDAVNAFGGEKWAAHSARVRVLVYDERHWPKNWGKPNSISWLADPRLSGNCTFANPRFGTTATHFSALLANDTIAQSKTVKSLFANEPQIVASNSAVVRSISQGDALLGLTDTDDVLIAQKQNPSLRFVIPDQDEGQAGTVITPASVAIVNNCPHPKLAKKFVRWLVSKSGESAMARSEMRNLPISSDAPPPTELPDISSIKIVPVNYAELVADWQAYLKFVESAEIRD